MISSTGALSPTVQESVPSPVVPRRPSYVAEMPVSSSTHAHAYPARRLKVVARQVNMRKRKVLVFWFVFVAIFVAFAPSLLNETTTEMDPPPESEAVKATTRLTAVFPEMARTTQQTLGRKDAFGKRSELCWTQS